MFLGIDFMQEHGVQLHCSTGEFRVGASLAKHPTFKASSPSMQAVSVRRMRAFIPLFVGGIDCKITSELPDVILEPLDEFSVGVIPSRPYNKSGTRELATFMSSEYWLGLKEATWNDAAIDCLSKGAKLVEIESSAEDNFILTLAMELTRNVWLGGTDMTVEGKWVWQSTGTIFSYSAWNGGQPNNYQNQTVSVFIDHTA
uniref:Nattectin n=1 Tax=Magallana gigas TaxID=29159 RepID=K1REW0_MAGGI